MVLGFTGFLGSHMTRMLLNNNHEIVGIKRKTSSLEKVQDIGNRIKTYDVEEIDRLFEENKIEVVINCATKYDRKNSNIQELIQSNTLFPLSVLERAINNKVECFINTDTFLNKNNFKQNYLLGYSLSKKQFLEWAKLLTKNTKTKFINMRLEHLYGINDKFDKFIPYVINQMKTNVKSIDLTEGNQKRDFIYVDDVCDAYKCIINNIEKIQDFKEIEVGTGKSIALKDMVLLVKKKLNSVTKLNFGKIPYREDEIMDSYAQNSYLKELGWKPRYDLNKGISKLL